MLSLRVQAIVLGACVAFAGAASDGRAQEPFYKGKRLTVLINFAAGGPADIEGRIFAKYLVKHIDGRRPWWCRTWTAPVA
jgi:tripartite-type tricarboxylate transporter receptor subunit TctC